jgi:predicted transcriptional regulator
MNDTIAAAITEMKRQRDQLTVAIDTLEALHGDAAPARTKRAVRGPQAVAARRATGRRLKPAARHQGEGDRGPEILNQLASGAASTEMLASSLNITSYYTKKALKALVAKGLVHRAGSTSASRWHLGVAGKRKPGAPAKEAP